MTRTSIGLAIALFTSVALARGDEIELANGRKMQGKVISRTADSVVFSPGSQSGVATVKLPMGSIRNIRIDAPTSAPAAAVAPAAASQPAPASQPVAPTAPATPHQPAAPALAHAHSPAAATPASTPAPLPAGALASLTAAPTAAGPASEASQRPTRTRTEVEALIAQAGQTPPDWWNAVPLNYPKSLDLTWSPPGKQWNNQKNLGQFIWDIINPNPNRWREGVRLLHHCLTVNQKNTAKLQQTMQALGRMYYALLEDWPRAVFWWRQAARMSGGQEDFPLEFAECYWKMGCRDMAVETLRRIRSDYTRNGSVIKLWADMGDVPQALALAQAKARAGMPDAAYLAAGDACRLAGRYSEALAYYQKVLALKRGVHDFAVNQKRAQASIEAIKVFDALDLKRVPDGTYQSGSQAYAGPLRVAVTVKAGRIESVKVIEHQEKQFYASITDTPNQIVARQGVKGVDAVSGATVTSEAIINATAKALAGAMK
jgi:uncharacterized protein with FMN-binding domain